jgi:hypothetical protein
MHAGFEKRARRSDTNRREQARNRADCFPVHMIKMSCSTNERVELFRVEAGFAVMLSSQLEQCESILIRAKPPLIGLSK